MIAHRARRFREMWAQPHPSALVSREYLSVHAAAAVRIHRRTLMGRGRGWAAPAVVVANLWASARWCNGKVDQALAEVEESRMARFTAATGVPIPTQRARLRTLAVRHSIPPLDAYQLGLLRDGWPKRWAEFVFACEEGWNAAASGQGGQGQLRLLGDKVQTSRRLAAAGIACVEEVLLTPKEWTDAEIDTLVAGWLPLWPHVHGKRRFGSRGEGAFEITCGDAAVTLPGAPLDCRQVTGEARDNAGPSGGKTQPGDAWTLREYQTDSIIADPMAWLREHLAASEYLIQPRLTSHSMFDDVACPSDVVTIRLVTRDVGLGPQLFSVVLEVPLPVRENRQFYVLLRVEPEGFVTGTVFPEWLRQPSTDDKAARVGDGDDTRATPAAIIQNKLQGRQLPEFASLADDAVRAHMLFPGLFAVAWDVAVTDAGYVFLEGNGGFGTREPQWVSGGLLAGPA